MLEPTSDYSRGNGGIVLGKRRLCPENRHLSRKNEQQQKGLKLSPFRTVAIPVTQRFERIRRELQWILASPIESRFVGRNSGQHTKNLQRSRGFCLYRGIARKYHWPLGRRCGLLSYSSGHKDSPTTDGRPELLAGKKQQETRPCTLTQEQLQA